MALNFLRENPLASLQDRPVEAPARKQSVHKIPKLKFFLLLAAKLTLWICVSGFYLEINPASIRESMHEFNRRRGLVVTGVVCNSKMQSAIISDEICNIGDTVKGYTIVNINKQGVEFKKGKKKIFKEIAPL